MGVHQRQEASAAGDSQERCGETGLPVGQEEGTDADLGMDTDNWGDRYTPVGKNGRGAKGKAWPMPKHKPKEKGRKGIGIL